MRSILSSRFRLVQLQNSQRYSIYTRVCVHISRTILCAYVIYFLTWIEDNYNVWDISGSNPT